MCASSTLPSDNQILTIADVIAQFDPQAASPTLFWVEGEVIDLSRAESGHSYFKLAASDSQIDCVLWSRVAHSLPRTLQEGDVVVAHGWSQQNPKGGGIEIDVRNFVVRGGKGPRHTSFQTLKDKLEAEGLLDRARKRALPMQPTCIQIVTSPDGDVVHDIRSILQRRTPGVRTQLAPARVTGEGAADQIAARIRSLAASGRGSVIILARGGGSTSDLAAFNSEQVVRAIADSPVPVISAIGHEPDVTLADLVADVRCATPSEAAELVAGQLRETARADATEVVLHVGSSRVTVRIDPASTPA